MNRELWDPITRSNKVFQFHGNSLKNLFQRTKGLESIKLCLDQCVNAHVERILVEEEALSMLHNQQESLESLSMIYPYFESVQSISQMLNPLTNLKVLCLSQVFVAPSQHLGLSRANVWSPGLGASLLHCIGTVLCNLQSLSIDRHGFIDADIQGLLPILPQLRSLSLEIPSQVSLTDQFMNLVAGNCGNLQSLELSYNQQITSAGWLAVAEACPLLRNIVAYDTGLQAIHLEELVRCSPKLLRVCFSSPYDKSAIEKATTASQGCTLFIDSSPYKPTFNSQYLKNHERTKKMLSDLQANKSNGWNEWEEFLKQQD